jgi:hypothetical protein
VWRPGPVRQAGPRPRFAARLRRGRLHAPPWPQAAQFIGAVPRWVEGDGGGVTAEATGGGTGLVETVGGGTGLVETVGGGAGLVEGGGGGAGLVEGGGSI